MNIIGDYEAHKRDEEWNKLEELREELWKCRQNRASNMETIKRLEAALVAIADDPVLDTDTQRLLRARKVARAALGVDHG
jgi:translation initiation factor 2B subunit (eIF-2B alpha/beta/delta family)